MRHGCGFCGAGACASRGFAALLTDGTLDLTQLSQPFAFAGATVNAAATGTTTTFFDGTFNSSDWTLGPQVYTDNAANGSIINVQSLTGGDPGAFWESTTSVTATGTSMYRNTFFNNAAIYNPSISGAITGMSGGFMNELLSFTSIRDVVDAGIVLRQNGGVYAPGKIYGLQDVVPGWYGNSTLFGPTGAVQVSSAFSWQLAAGTGPAHPDFSGTGAAIQFGLLTGGYFDSGSGTIVGGLDDWTITVTSDVAAVQPEPGAVPLAGAVMIFFRRRRRGLER